MRSKINFSDIHPQTFTLKSKFNFPVNRRLIFFYRDAF